MQERFAADYAQYEESHWWFKARRRILRRLIIRLPLGPHPHILEIGTGPGANLYAIYPRDAVITGLEKDPAQAERARSRGPIPVLTIAAEDAADALAGTTFDVVTMFDVLEHIERDKRVLATIHQLLVPDGRLLLTVPAYALLWGPQDIVSGHRRRYTLHQLCDRVRRAGFAIERATYFNTLLFPAIACVRFLKRTPKHPTTDFKISLGPLDQVLEWIFGLEAWLLRVTDLPFGVSIYVAARSVDRVSTTRCESA